MIISDKSALYTLKPGIYVSETNNNHLDNYRVAIDVKETEKSYIFQLVDFQSRYSAHLIDDLFNKSNRVVIRKDKGNHAIRKWSNEDFTIYPFRIGTPYYFVRQENGELCND